MECLRMVQGSRQRRRRAGSWAHASKERRVKPLLMEAKWVREKERLKHKQPCLVTPTTCQPYYTSLWRCTQVLGVVFFPTSGIHPRNMNLLKKNSALHIHT